MSKRALAEYYKEMYFTCAQRDKYESVGVPLEAIKQLKKGDSSFFHKNTAFMAKMFKTIITDLDADNAIDRKIFLELGCGWGQCLLAAKEAGLRPVGYELGRECAKIGALLGLNIKNIDLLTDRIDRDSVFYLYLSHSLEHLRTPLAYLEKMYAICEPKGILHCCVPNFESYWHEQAQQNWDWLDRNSHLLHFTRSTLSRMVSKAGFQVVSCTTVMDVRCDSKNYQYAAAELQLDKESHSDQIIAFLKEKEKEHKGESVMLYARKA